MKMKTQAVGSQKKQCKMESSGRKNSWTDDKLKVVTAGALENYCRTGIRLLVTILDVVTKAG